MQPRPVSPSERKALAFMIFGYCLLGLQPLGVRALQKEHFDAAEVVFYRFALGLLPLLHSYSRLQELRAPERWGLLCLRGLFGASSVLLYFLSVQWCGAARGTLLNYTYPLWANLLASLGGERNSGRAWLQLAGAFLGVLLLIYPENPSAPPLHYWEGSLAGLCSGALAGASVLSVQRLRKTEDTTHILAAFTLGSLLFSLPFVLRDKAEHPHFGGSACFYLGFVALVSYYGHYFFTRSYREVSVMTGTSLSLLVPAVSTLTGVLIYGEHFSGRAALGASILALALSADTLKKLLSAEPSQTPSLP